MCSAFKNFRCHGRLPHRSVLKAPASDWWLLRQQFWSTLSLKTKIFSPEKFWPKSCHELFTDIWSLKSEFYFPKGEKLCWLEQQIDIKLRPFNVFHQLLIFSGGFEIWFCWLIQARQGKIAIWNIIRWFLFKLSLWPKINLLRLNQL